MNVVHNTVLLVKWLSTATPTVLNVIIKLMEYVTTFMDSFPTVKNLIPVKLQPYLANLQAATHLLANSEPAIIKDIDEALSFLETFDTNQLTPPETTTTTLAPTV